MYTEAQLDAAINNAILLAGVGTLLLMTAILLGVGLKTRDARYLRVSAMSLLFAVATLLANTVVHPVLTWAFLCTATITVGWVGVRTLPLFGFLDE